MVLGYFILINKSGYGFRLFVPFHVPFNIMTKDTLIIYKERHYNCLIFNTMQCYINNGEESPMARDKEDDTKN